MRLAYLIMAAWISTGLLLGLVARVSFRRQPMSLQWWLLMLLAWPMPARELLRSAWAWLGQRKL